MSAYKKIMIFGRPGSGKSTFAKWLCNALNLPLYHLDKFFFEANWQQRNYQEFLNIQQKIVDKSCWIIDGNSTKSFEMRYARANLAIYFYYPLHICYFRILKRLFKKDATIDDWAHGCLEKISWSLLSYTWNYGQKVKLQLKNLKNKYPNVEFIIINNDNDLKRIKARLLNNTSLTQQKF